MMGPTHMLGGAAAWLAGCAVMGPPPGVTVIGGAVAVAGALAPDIDHERAEAAQWCRLAGSAIAAAGVAALMLGPSGSRGVVLLGGGAALGLLPWAVRPRRGGFRGIVHSRWGLAGCLVLAGLAVAAGVPWWAGAAFTAGWCSHLALDALTREGLRLDWPSQVRYGWLPKSMSMRTGGRKPGTGRKRKGKWRRRRRQPVGREYVFVQPVLVAVCLGAGWLALVGGHL